MENKEDILATIEIDLKKVAWSSLIQTVLLSIIGLLFYGWLYDGFQITFSFLDFLLVCRRLCTYLSVLHECFLSNWVLVIRKSSLA